MTAIANNEGCIPTLDYLENAARMLGTNLPEGSKRSNDIPVICFRAWALLSPICRNGSSASTTSVALQSSIPRKVNARSAGTGCLESAFVTTRPGFNSNPAWPR